MRLLVLGGTRFVGRPGMEPGLPPELEAALLGD